MRNSLWDNVLWLLVLGMGCGGTDDGSVPSGAVDRRLETQWRAGGSGAEGPMAWGQISALAIDAAGRAYLVDRQAQHLVVLDADGHFLRTIGRRGSGPGEFEGVYGVAFDPAQHLWVADTRNQRFTVVDTSGALLATYRRPSNCFRYAWDGTITTAGEVLDFTCGMVNGQTQFVLARFDTAGVHHDSIPIPVIAEADIPEPFRVLDDRGRIRALASVPFATSHQWHLSRDRSVWFGWTGEYRIIQRSWSGDTVNVITHEVPRAPVTDQEMRDAVASLAWIEQQGGTLDAQRIPDRHVAFERFQTDAAGRLWVMRRSREGGLVLDLFAQGRFAGTQRVPPEVGPAVVAMAVQGDDLWFVGHDSLDAPTLTRARLIVGSR